jgi:predicted RND superfamily exporter protein
MRGVAARNETFNATLAANDLDGDGVPEQNVASVYDALYAVAPEQAASVIERSGSEYRSVRVLVPTRGDADFTDVTGVTRDAAAAIAGSGVTATATGQSVVISVQIDILTDNILLTLVVSLVAIFLLLVLVYRLTEGSATLGAVTVLPIALVVAYVFGAMLLLDVPLTLFTALMLSLAIGLGIDYAIHVSERFAQELPDASDPEAALDRTVRGTGGALLGSTATTVGAFATLSLSTFPTVRQLGIMVALALVFSFVASVFVLPSLLTLWARRIEVESLELGSRSPADDD